MKIFAMPDQKGTVQGVCVDACLHVRVCMRDQGSMRAIVLHFSKLSLVYLVYSL